jgi:hypothetical protein
MSKQPMSSVPAKRFPFLAAVVLIAAVFACAIYTNLSFAVKDQDPAKLRYFPPFEAYRDANDNRHLGAEYFNIAKSMRAGEGFANPFNNVKTGPTAWMPPVLSVILAGLLWLCGDDRDTVMAVVIFLQVYSLIATGLLVLALTRQTTRWIGAWLVAAIYFGALLCDFRQCFQFTHDSWLIMLTLNAVVAGFCWFGPLGSWPKSVAWGLLGGLSALVNPIVALVWGVLSLIVGFRDRSWRRFALAASVAALTLVPWTARNYLVFGRLLPVKSNLAYELYQSQCLQPEGMLQNRTFGSHPYGNNGRERQEYVSKGEIAFLDHKREQFLEAVKADPLDFCDRVANRFLGTMLWYVPFNPENEAKRSWVLPVDRITHPLPFLGLLILVVTALWRPLHWYQWVAIGVYVLYLSPYIVVSYYERYALPLIGVKVLLVVWGLDRLLWLLPWRKPVEDEALVALEPVELIEVDDAVTTSP